MQGMPTLSTTPGADPSDDGIAAEPLIVSFDLTVLEESVLAVCVGRAVIFDSAETADTSVTVSAERLRLSSGGTPRIVDAPSLVTDRTELVGVGSFLVGSFAVGSFVVESFVVGSCVDSCVGTFVGIGCSGTLGLGLGLGGGLVVVGFSLPLRDVVLRFRTTTRTSGLGEGCWGFSLPFTLATLRTLGALLEGFGVVSFGTGGLGALSIRFRSAGALEAVETVDRTDRTDRTDA